MNLKQFLNENSSLGKKIILEKKELDYPEFQKQLKDLIHIEEQLIQLVKQKQKFETEWKKIHTLLTKEENLSMWETACKERKVKKDYTIFEEK